MNDRIALARHSMALWLLVILMTIFALNAGKLAARSRQELFDDPVISSMSWESSSDVNARLDDLTIGTCNVICPTNCPVDNNCPVDSGCPLFGNCPDSPIDNCNVICPANC